jgi:carboxyl-terminal processing protease
VSSYDDPRWYEQPEQQMSNFEAGHDNPKPFAAADDASSQQASAQSASSQARPSHDKWYRFGRPLGQFVVIVALMIIAFLGGWFGHQLAGSTFNLSNKSQSYESLIEQAWVAIDQNYVDRSAINYQQMSYDAIRAMLADLHDTGHTRFLTPADVQAENQDLSGTFVGVGISIVQDSKTKQFIIASVIPGSPAEKSGLKRGDIITAVNGASTAGKDLNTVQSTIHNGNAGTSVTITVKRPPTNQTLIIKVTREQFDIPNVLMHYIPQDHIAQIQIVQFANGVSDQLKDALSQAKKLGATKIILDLRDNPGGYLQEAINVASEFIGKGNVLLEQDSSGKRTPIPVNGHPINTTSQMVVLVNSNTASAAEIVSGALEDDHRAIILGTKTFGTGTVLEEFPLSDGSAILLGTSEWLTPDGQFIRNQGITPTPGFNVALPTNVNPLTPGDENDEKLSEQQILSSGDTQLIDAIHYLESH